MIDTTFNTLITEVSKIEVPTEKELAFIKTYFEPVTISRNTILEEQDKIPNFLYFIVSGYMRLFFYVANGEEQTTYLCAKNGFIASFSALINQTKAPEHLECITDCELLKISFANTKILIDKSVAFKNFSVNMLEKAMHASTIRANDLANLNAEQRYKKIIAQQPHFIQNIPLQYIATYLGIKPQSLSRIRKQIIK